MAQNGTSGLVLITGASSGLGEAFARAYAAAGHDLALVARRVDRLEALAAELAAAHQIRAQVIGADLSLFGAERTVLDAVAERGSRIDILVNNAGFSIPQSFAAVPWAAQRDFLMTLVVSACGLAHGVLPAMTARGEGVIINVASLAGFAPGAVGHTLYPFARLPAWPDSDRTNRIVFIGRGLEERAIASILVRRIQVAIRANEGKAVRQS